MSEAICKKCRRAGEKLFLKGDKCFTPKCSFVLRPFAPGKLDSERKHRSQITEYGYQLKEKQKVKNNYGVSESQFAAYAKAAIVTATKVKDVSQPMALIQSLETRLDNTIYRMGLANSRALARQIVNHGHICVNGKRMSIPSYTVKIGDTITVREGSKVSKLFTINLENKKDHKSPSWLKADISKLTAEMISLPKEITETFDLAKVFEFYSR